MLNWAKVLLTTLASLAILVSLAILWLVSVPLRAEDHRPNVVVILADDLGFTDLGHYGSEISTPNIDALAHEGISFSNYHTAASCAPARAMLMTGVNSHKAGVAMIPEMVPESLRHHPTYQGVLSKQAVTIATLLYDAGYHTYLSGKWHLGSTPDLLPYNRGFERTFTLADSGADNWEQRPYLPLYDKANWFKDGKRTTLPDDFYSSRDLVDTMIEFIARNQGDGKPFFAYLPLQAVHIPVQAPQDYIDRYMGKYDKGWDTLRDHRQKRAKEIGLVPATSDMARMTTTKSWDGLSDHEKRYEAKRMAVYGGMIEAMDYHIGRLIAWLKAAGEFENTTFIFTSDNGAEASDMTVPMARLSSNRLEYHYDYETLGLKRSMNSIGASFASAAAAPLSWYKFQVGEGGMRVPLVISGPTISKHAGFQNTLAWVADLAPTILNLTGTALPGKRFGGRPIYKMDGKDLTSVLRGQSAAHYSDDDFIAYELAGSKVVFGAQFKAIYHAPPIGSGDWQLYDIVNDPGETQEILDNHPLIFQQMLSAYEVFAVRTDIQPLPTGYDQRYQVGLNYLVKSIPIKIYIFLLTVLVLLPFWVWWRKPG